MIFFSFQICIIYTILLFILIVTVYSLPHEEYESGNNCCGQNNENDRYLDNSDNVSNAIAAVNNSTVNNIGQIVVNKKRP